LAERKIKDEEWMDFAVQLALLYRRRDLTLEIYAASVEELIDSSENLSRIHKAFCRGDEVKEEIKQVIFSVLPMWRGGACFEEDRNEYLRGGRKFGITGILNHNQCVLMNTL
jgi:hypothetical protein